MIKKILVALDGSDLADKSLDFALDLAEKYSAKVTLLTVIDTPSNSFWLQGTVFTPNSSKDNLENLRKFHKEILSKAFKKADAYKNIPVTKKILEGRPADKIIEIAVQESFDLIVMGSRGLGGIKEIFLGSVSDRVADKASCPVLIIK
jgi:nucleotide-binding universal stress UspA family protein